MRGDAFLAARKIAVRETVDARTQRYSAADLPALMKGASEVLVAKGKKSQVFEPGTDKAAWKEVAEVAIGPTGNLRAPTLRRGKRWIVGFGEDAWREALG
ncbi:MAG TPA: ArsC family (seleno)protein [Planctomycetota bacterium]|nr:ArsC family (seleno)protein [Planctomycetota bacterium]